MHLKFESILRYAILSKALICHLGMLCRSCVDITMLCEKIHLLCLSKALLDNMDWKSYTLADGS